MRLRVFSGLLRYSRYLQYQQSRFGASSTMEKPVESAIKKKLREAFNPTVLEVKNESRMHKVPKGSETHFKVLVVTEKFESLPLIKRHRLVNETLQEELQSGVHALSIVFMTGALNYAGASLCATSYYLPRAYNAPLGRALVYLKNPLKHQHSGKKMSKNCPNLLPAKEGLVYDIIRLPA